VNLNKVFLVGRLAADPESRTTTSGQVVSTIRLATSRVWNDRNTGQKQEQTEFHTIVAWGGLADIISKYLRKGQLALFEGRIQTRSWQGQDGVKRYKTEIVADNMQLGPKAMNTGASYQSGNNSDQSAPRSPNSSYSAKQSDNNSAKVLLKEEDIPVINEDSPITSDPVAGDESDDIEEKEIDLKDIPF